MNTKFVSRLALSILVIVPAVSSPSYAGGPEHWVYAPRNVDARPRESGPDSETCRSYRQTAELIHQMQGFEGGLPFLIPADCNPDNTAKRRDEEAHEAKLSATEAVRAQ